ncbi:MAG: hypothetical protein R3B44_04930 [Candidatus Brocadiaceae bacterium]
MGGIYGQLTIAAYITFVVVLFGFIITCVVYGRKAEKKTPDSKGQ